MDIGEQFITYVQNGRPQLDLFFVGDLPRFTTAADRVQEVVNAARNGNSPPSNFCGMYWPHVEVADPAGNGANPTLVIPASGYMAGLYGRTDGRRGVWKAPAGIETRVARRRATSISTGPRRAPGSAQSARRQCAAAHSQRRTGGMGRAHAAKPSDRRMALHPGAATPRWFLRKSIYNGIQWAVFEPNDQRLWPSLALNIGAFMDDLSSATARSPGHTLARGVSS